MRSRNGKKTLKHAKHITTLLQANHASTGLLCFPNIERQIDWEIGLGQWQLSSLSYRDLDDHHLVILPCGSLRFAVFIGLHPMTSTV